MIDISKVAMMYGRFTLNSTQVEKSDTKIRLRFLQDHIRSYINIIYDHIRSYGKSYAKSSSQKSDANSYNKFHIRLYDKILYDHTKLYSVVSYPGREIRC